MHRTDAFELGESFNDNIPITSSSNDTKITTGGDDSVFIDGFGNKQTVKRLL